MIPWTAAQQASLSFIIPCGLLKFMSIEAVMTSNHLIFCCPLLLLPAILPSIRVFSNELVVHIRWQSIGASASASVLPMYIQGSFPLELTGLIPCCQRTLRILQFESTSFSELSFLCGPALTSVFDYRITIALTTWTFVSKVMSLLLNTLPKFVIAFLPRSNCLLIS